METNNDELIPVTITRDEQGNVEVEIGHLPGKKPQHELWTEQDIEAVSSTRQRIRKLLSDYFA